MPQELATDAFTTVLDSVRFSRGLFGKPPNAAYLEKLLRDLSLWDKKSSRIMTLSGGMKRRLMIAKALSHEPCILFLDEPTAGVDVELRRDMWAMVRALRERGVTIILTTHYIEEAEEMADRVGVINKGEIILVEDKAALMHKLGEKRLTLALRKRLERVPDELGGFNLSLSADGSELVYTFAREDGETGIAPLMRRLADLKIDFRDLEHQGKFARRDLRQPGQEAVMNLYAIRAIYRFEMARMWRTMLQSVVSPVISTSLYFIVFGGAVGSHMATIGGVSYGAFIVPGLTMLSLLTNSIANASFGIYFPRFAGTIYEILSAPVSPFEIVFGYVGAAASKSIIIGLIILVTARCSSTSTSSIRSGWSSFLILTSVDLQPVRLHHRHLGRRLREAAARAAAHRHAADLPWRQLLFDRHAAAVLAHRHAGQSRSSISSAAFAGAFTASPTSASASASA